MSKVGTPSSRSRSGGLKKFAGFCWGRAKGRRVASETQGGVIMDRSRSIFKGLDVFRSKKN